MAITRQIIFLAKKDCIEELKALLKSTIKDSKEEEGCLMYEVFQTKNNPVEFIVIDSWESEEALNSAIKNDKNLCILTLLTNIFLL